jgi:hypothetical protein
MRRLQLFSHLAAAGLGFALAALAAGAAATPFTYVLTIPNATGMNNGVAFTDQTLIITVQADTAQIIPVANYIGTAGLPGNCVPATTNSIVVVGGATVAAVAPVFLCADLRANFVGLFTDPTVPALSWYFLANYGDAGFTNYNLAVDFPLTANVPPDAGITEVPLDLAGGGTASITVSPAVGTTFEAMSLTFATIPTLGPVGLAALAGLLVTAALTCLRRRRPA